MTGDVPLILVVDDDHDFLVMTRRVLESAGYAVACATSPCEALDTMAQAKPDLVITDLMMRALDSGFSFARKIKSDARFADVPVLLITAVASRLGYDFTPDKVDDLAEMHVDGFFEKPVLPNELLAQVEALIGLPVQEGKP